MKPRQSERDFQATAEEYLKMHHWKVYAYARSGARARCPACSAWIGRLAALPKGHVDIIAIKENEHCFRMTIEAEKGNTQLMGHTLRCPRIVFIECKRVGETLDPDQERERDELLALGCEVYMVSTLEEVVKIDNGTA